MLIFSMYPRLRIKKRMIWPKLLEDTLFLKKNQRNWLKKKKEKLVSTNMSPIELSMPKLGGAEVSNVCGKCENYVEIFATHNLSNNDWQKPTVEYLENPTGITNRKTQYRALSYVIIGNELSKTIFYVGLESQRLLRTIKDQYLQVEKWYNLPLRQGLNY